MTFVYIVLRFNDIDECRYTDSLMSHFECSIKKNRIDSKLLASLFEIFWGIFQSNPRGCIFLDAEGISKLVFSQQPIRYSLLFSYLYVAHAYLKNQDYCSLMLCNDQCNLNRQQAVDYSKFVHGRS